VKKSDRLKRMVAFYLSVVLFFVTLPILLSYSLGYHIDYNALKVYKTGILYINSHPAGASVYVNGKLHPSLTPTQVEELKPGNYRVEVRREDFYPWERELAVRPNMVTKADRIVLFPVTQDVKKVGNRETFNFVAYDKNNIYYMNGKGLFKSSIDGTVSSRISRYSNWPDRIIAKKFSPDSDKFLYYTERAISVVYLDLDKTLYGKGSDAARVEEVMTTTEPIRDVFWYSGSGYIIVITESDIKVVELRGGEKRNIITLYKFNKRPQGLFYDRSADSLYFTDISKDSGKSHLYRLDLRQTFLDSLKQFLMKKEDETQDEKR